MEDLYQTPFATHMTLRKKKPTAPAMKRAVAGVGQSRIMRVCAVLCKELFFLVSPNQSVCSLLVTRIQYSCSELVPSMRNSFNVQI